MKIINDLRDDGRAELKHNDFTAKIRKVLGDEGAKFSAPLKTNSGQTAQGYNLPKRESHLMVMSESYKVQAAVYDRMTELETALQFKIPSNYLEAMQLATKQMEENQLLLGQIKETEQERDFAIKSKAWIGSSREASTMGKLAQAKQKIIKQEKIIDFLTVEHVFTPTDLGNKLGIKAQAFNDILLDSGYQTREYVGGGYVYTPTDLGKDYSKLVEININNGMTKQQLKWSARILPVIEAIIKKQNQSLMPFYDSKKKIGRPKKQVTL